MSSRVLLATSLAVLVWVSHALAGENPNAKLALHVVASYDFLGCAELAPAACESINVDVSQQELADADGYGYVVLVAYDIDSVTGVEFALDGWPTGRGAPSLSGPYWCEDALTLGNHEDSGGVTAFQSCVEPDSSSSVASLAYWFFGPLDSTDLPIDLSVIASTYSDQDSVLYIMDCTVDHVIDDVVLASGCTIGGTHSGTQPECGLLDEENSGESGGSGEEEPDAAEDTDIPSGSEEQAQGGTGEGGVEDGGGLTVESIDPDTAPGNQPIKLEIIGDGFGVGTFFTLSRIGGDIWADRWQLDGDDKVMCSFILAKADTGLWDVNAIAFGDTATLEDGFKVDGVVADEDAVFQGYRLTVAFQDEILNLGGRESTTREEIEYIHPDVEALVDSFGVTTLEKLFKDSTKGDTLATARNGDIVRVEDLSGFHVLHATEPLDVLAAVRAFRALPDSLVVNAGPSYIAPLADVANDRYLDGNGSPTLQLQWGFWNVGQQEGKFDADIDATDAWSIETGSESVRAVVLDSGIRASHYEFMGKIFDSGPDFYYGDDEPDDIDGHGTACAGIIGALTNNECPGGGNGCGNYTNGLVAGMAGGWGNYEGTGPTGTPLAAVKVCGDGDDEGCPTAYTAPGFDWARNHDAAVINHSIGSAWPSLALAMAIHNCAMEGIVTASSMGNCSQHYPRPEWRCIPGTSEEADLNYVPAQDADVIAVGASERWDRRVSHLYVEEDLSDWSSMIGHYIDVVAPGYQHHSTDADADYAVEPFGGTSCASPVVAGTVALLLSYCDEHYDPCPLAVDAVEALIEASAEDVTEDLTYGQIPPGWDRYSGAGRVNAERALQLLQDHNGLGNMVHREAVGGPGNWTGHVFYDGTNGYYQYRVTRTVEFSPPFEDVPIVWGNSRSVSTGSPPWIFHEFQIPWRFCRVVPNSVTPTQATLETYLYWKCDYPENVCWWFGASPENVVFSYVTMPPPVWLHADVELEIPPEEFADLNPSLSVSGPNPFNAETTLKYSISDVSHMRIVIYDILGREVRTLLDKVKFPGKYALVWDGKNANGQDVASGIYFGRMEAGDFCQMCKIAVVR